ncbi:MAG: tetratricopeptide repeat protein, partial [Parcubacteria group bacterium]|nr:tetratricopeptide repeat protein [Parcubacteria group bacterium]
GRGLEVGTVVNILILSVLLFLVPLLIRSQERVFSCYLAFFAAAGLLALFHLLRFALGPDFLSFGILTDAAANTVGKWNDLAVFFGASALFSLVTIELISLGRFFRTLLYCLLVVSLFFLAVINFGLVWFALGLFALVFLVYLISFGARDAGSSPDDVANMLDGAAPRPNGRAPGYSPRRLPMPALTLLLISVVFMLGGANISAPLSARLGVSQVEARPSWSATFAVAKQTLVKDPLLGAGPNRFTPEWLRYKPAGINETIFWGVDFQYGIGLIPTFLATTGILGALSWVAFFILFLSAGFGAMLRETADKLSRYLSTSSFLVALFLWVFTVVYIPSLTLFTLAFFFTGLFLASLFAERALPRAIISFVKDPRAGFISVLILILLLIGSVTLGYLLTQKYVASVYFERGVRAFNRDGNVGEAERLIQKAAAISPLDVYFRFLADISLFRMNTALAAPPGASADSVRSEFQTLLGAALGSARQAVALNKTNYENLISLGRVYEAVVPLKIPGAYESARASYEEALSLNPESPALFLTLARLEAAKGDNAKAREEIARALTKKGNYTEAIFFLSQVEAREGNIKAAISSVEAASVIAPNDATVFFQLGLLRYNDRDFRGAIGALERAVALNPAYANAKYFLGLSYERVGRDADAVRQFQDIQKTNPDNKEIELILRNLKAGRAPFADAPPPLDAAPEKRPKLPVGEEEE